MRTRYKFPIWLALFLFIFQANPLSANSDYPMLWIEAGQVEYNIPIPTSNNPITIRRIATVKNGFWIGIHEVSRDLWNHCVSSKFCTKTPQKKNGEGPLHPIARLNWHDAYQFSQWMSLRTGDLYRLPTEDEWMLALGKEEEIKKSTLTRAIGAIAPKLTQKQGTFGFNKNGISDMLGNVWEWTLTCWKASRVDIQRPEDIKELKSDSACTLRVLRGQQRAHLQDFISETSTGGCSGQIAPSLLGFRLVKEAKEKNHENQTDSETN